MSDKTTIRDEAPAKKYFTQMLNMAEDDLDPFQYRLLAHYVRWGAEQGSLYDESIRVTAKNTKMSVNKVQSTLNELEALGYIEVYRPTPEEARVLHMPTRIKVLDRWLENITRYQNKAVSNSIQPVSDLTQSSIKNDTGAVSNMIRLEEQNTEELRTDTPLPPKRGKREKSSNANALEENDEIVATIKAYVDGLSIVPATNQYGNKTTRAAAAAIHKAGYTPEQVTQYTKYIQGQPYWQGKKPPLTTIAEGIAAYFAAHKPKPVFPIPEGHYDPAKDDGTPATLEQIQQAKAQWAALVKSKSGNSEVRS